MNRIFKTVFSRTRGVMMVANELTKSHQVGKKAAVAAAVAGVLGSHAVCGLAANSTVTEFDYSTGQVSVNGVAVPDDVLDENYSMFIYGGSYTSSEEHSYEMNIKGTSTNEYEWKTIAGAAELSGLLEFDYPDKSATVNIGTSTVKIEGQATSYGMGIFGGSFIQASRYFGISSEEGEFDSPIESITVNTIATSVTFTDAAKMTFFSGVEPISVVSAGDVIIGTDYTNPEVGSVRPSIEVRTNITNSTLTLSGGNYGDAILSGGSLVSTAGDGSIAINAYSNVEKSVINVAGNVSAAAIVGGGVAQDIISNFIYYDGEPRLESSVESSTINIGNNETDATKVSTDIYAGGLHVFYRYSEEPEVANIGAIGKVTVKESTINVTNAEVAGTIYGANAQGVLNEDDYSLVLSPTDQVVRTHIHMNNAKLNKVVLFEGSDINVAGDDNNISNLTFQNGLIRGTDSASKLTLTNTDFGSSVSLGGTLTLDGGLTNFAGTVDVNEALTLKLVNNSTFSGTLSVNVGGKLNYSGSELGAARIKLNGGTLSALSAELFKHGLGDKAEEKNAGEFVMTGLEVASGTLSVEDATYNLDYVKTANAAVSDAKLAVSQIVFTGDLINLEGEPSNELTFDQAVAAGDKTQMNNVTAVIEDTDKNTLKIGGDAPSGGEAGTTKYASAGIAVGDLNLGSISSVKVDGDQNLTLVGKGSDLLTSDASGGVSVDVTSGTLQIGGEGSKGGNLNADVTVGADGTMNVTGDASFKLDNVTANGQVAVENKAKIEAEDLTVSASGTLAVNSEAEASVKELQGVGTIEVGSNVESGRGKLSVAKLTMTGGKIFVDPAWTGDTALDTVGNASHLELYSLGDAGLAAKLIGGSNSLITIGTSAEEGGAAFEKIAAVRGMNWGEDNVEAALYVGAPVTFAETGGILLQGGATADSEVARGQLTVAPKAMVIFNQAASENVIEGKAELASGSFLGLVNAEVGAFTFATGAVTDNGASVVTDNPFIVGEINDNTVVNTFNAENGLGTLASVGIQAMARRADFVLAGTIADRTSLDQELGEGLALWADVSGERYEADSLDNGGSFTADTGYAAFGADFAITQDITAGAAIQYGTGTVRSDVASIKNEIDSYGITAYGSMKFGDAKLVGEFAYVKSENDITSSQTALNQKVDADIYSVGVRAQYQLQAGNFKFVPSIGLRVSRLETDAMQVGLINVEKQKQTLVQVPVALRITGAEMNASRWNLAPSFKIAYVPTFGDKEIEVLGYERDVIDTSPVQGEFGLRAQNGNLMLNANLMVGGGRDGTSALGGKIGVKYLF